jgi:hypothetical protein
MARNSSTFFYEVSIRLISFMLEMLLFNPIICFEITEHITVRACFNFHFDQSHATCLWQMVNGTLEGWCMCRRSFRPILTTSAPNCGIRPSPSSHYMSMSYVPLLTLLFKFILRPLVLSMTAGWQPFYFSSFYSCCMK